LRASSSDISVRSFFSSSRMVNSAEFQMSKTYSAIHSHYYPLEYTFRFLSIMDFQTKNNKHFIPMWQN
jgi:hypothetical protein